MTSDAFRSPSFHGSRREDLIIGSSSPDLPPLTDILSQQSNRHHFRSGNNAIPNSPGTLGGFIPTTSILNTSQHAQKAPIAKDADDSIEIVQISASSVRKKGIKEAGVKKASAAKKAMDKQKVAGGKRKQPQLKAKSTDELENSNETCKTGNAKSKTKKQPETTSKHFKQPAPIDSTTTAKDIDPNEPLNLEPATSRRIDWTPPAQKTVINIDSSSSALKQPASSERGDRPAFKDLVNGYSCIDEAPQGPAIASDEDSILLKKRKRIDLVAIQNAKAPEPEIAKKSPTKRKALKKKARTITELATAAYRVPSPSGDLPPSASILDHFPSTTSGSIETTDAAKKGKGKAAARKRPAKASKKKAPPPKPILLSPGAALDQVANQDFVFGTSSQLAREQSPTVLRDIQAALKHSYQTNDDNGTIFPNSDDFEPTVRRPKLWEAAARDADGDLFDIEVIDLAGDSPQLPEANDKSNPFGYLANENPNAMAIKESEHISSSDADSFVNLSDILLPPDKQSILKRDSPYLFDSDISTSTNINAPSSAQVEAAPRSPKTSTSKINESQHNSGLTSVPAQPNYNLFTDVQLSKEIRAYGFKPIKRRSAMIAMLDQCWQSKVRMGQAGFHTTSASSKPEGSAPTASPAKRPRGRPRKTSTPPPEPEVPPPTPSPGKKPRSRTRKTSVNASEPQEPPPSAQPPETPKRRRGRPRKDSTSQPSISSSPRTKSASPKKRLSRSPTRGKKATGPIIEIPDSEDEDGIDLASSPSSTIEQVFSSPPALDLSLATTEDPDLSLAASPSAQESALFEHITEAIRSAPRTTDPEHPSWHEKILLYDPIVLEDLAVWLNSGELTRVGFDTEVSPGEVKKWCESKSVCCLWRVNLRGKERRRF